MLDFIFYSQYPPNQTQVTYINSEVANAVLHCDLNFDPLITNKVLFGPMIHTMNMMFKTPVMIFGFCRGEHITGIIVNSTITSTTYAINRVPSSTYFKGTALEQWTLFWLFDNG